MAKDYKERGKEMDLNSRSLFQAAPEVMGGFRTLMAKATSDGALDAKTKELMALAIAVAMPCDLCVVFHARAAVRKGATREEVVEALEVAIEMGGGPAAVYSGEALAAFDQFAAG